VEGPVGERLSDDEGQGLIPERSARSRSGTVLVSLLAWAVLLVMAGLRLADSFAYVPWATLVIAAFGLVVALVVLWIVQLARVGLEPRFRWVWIAILATFVLILWNPAGDAVHAWGFQVAKPQLEEALASNGCPARAGAYRIKNCTSIGGDPFFVLEDSGFDTIDGLVKPADPTHFRPDGEFTSLGGGWYFVRIEF
jgi:hypothetical protein